MYPAVFTKLEHHFIDVVVQILNNIPHKIKTAPYVKCKVLYKTIFIAKYSRWFKNLNSSYCCESIEEFFSLIFVAEYYFFYIALPLPLLLVSLLQLLHLLYVDWLLAWLENLGRFAAACLLVLLPSDKINFSVHVTNSIFDFV